MVTDLVTAEGSVLDKAMANVLDAPALPVEIRLLHTHRVEGFAELTVSRPDALTRGLVAERAHRRRI